MHLAFQVAYQVRIQAMLCFSSCHLVPFVVEQPVERAINNCQLRVEFSVYRYKVFFQFLHHVEIKDIVKNR